MKRLLLAISLCLPWLAAAAQDEVEYRLELGAAAGAGFSLDDANSRFYGGTGLAGGLVSRFPLNPRMAVKTALGYVRTGGDVAGAGDFYPAHGDAASPERLDYSFSGGIADLSALFELHFLPYGYARGYLGNHRLVPYIQAGIGLAYATPGKAFGLNFPIGAGLKYKVAKRLNLGIEWRMHFSLSDKLDGLAAPLGIPSQGFRNKDHYSFTLVTLTYDLSPKCPNCNKD